MSAGLIIWDYNGTILNDTPAWIEAAKAHYRIFLNKELDSEELRAAYDTPITKVAAALGVNYNDFDKETNQHADEVFHDTFKKHLKLSTREGIPEAIKALKDAEYKNCVFSNHEDIALHQEIETLGISDLFRTISGREQRSEIITRTTKSDRIQKYIQMSGATKDRICIIGDSQEEARIAKEFGIVAIGLTGGYSSDKSMDTAGFDMIVETAACIPYTVQRLLR